MQSFWNGFEKRAKDKKKYTEGQLLTDAVIGLVAPKAASTGAGLLMNQAAKLDPNLSILDQIKLTHESNKGLKRKIAPIIIPPSAGYVGFYTPNEHKVISAPKAGILAHEFGHAKNFQGPFEKMHGLNKLRLGLHSRGFLTASGIAPVFGAIVGDQDVADASPYLSLLAAPLVLEEGAASLRGLKSIAKSLGVIKALKAAPGRVAAGLTYASIPMAGAYMAHRIAKKKREAKS